MKNNPENADFSVSTHEILSYEGVEKLDPFLTEQKKILSRRNTGLSPKQQKELTKAVKTARIVGLSSFVITE